MAATLELFDGVTTLNLLDKTNYHAESVLSFDIWGPLELDLTFIFDRVENPVANADDIVPKSNDYSVTMGLGVDF